MYYIKPIKLYHILELFVNTKINQARAIGKLRITAPKKEKDVVYPIDKLVRTDILNKIDLEMKNLVIK